MTPNINKILKESPRPSRYGAPMGAGSYLDNPEIPLYVQRVRMVDHCYSPDGTYWGGYPAPPLFCAFSVEGDNRIYVRGKDRADALKAVLKDWPDAKFVKPLKEAKNA